MSIAPPFMATGVPVEESEMSSKGQGYTAANHGRIENKGQQVLNVMTNEGRQGKTCCQIGDVNRPLLSVSQIADAGNIVMMASFGGWVHNLYDGSWTKVRRHNNVYEMELWLTSDQANGKVQGDRSPTDEMANTMLQTFKDVLMKSGFTRPGL